MSNPNWIVRSKTGLRSGSGDGPHFQEGDHIEYESPKPLLKITRGETTCLHVSLASTTSFPRDPNRSHKLSRRYQGEVHVVRVGELETLLCVIGYKKEKDPYGDDDDTEVVVATRPSGA